MTGPSPHETVSHCVPLQRQLMINGTTTHYWEYAGAAAAIDAPTLVFVHGFRGDHHGFEAIIAELPESRIIVPDLPGFGASEPLSLIGSTKHDIDSYATWLKEFVAHVDLRPPVIIVGHSLGSIVTSAAIAQGLRPAGTILINPIATLSRLGVREFFRRLITIYYWLTAILPNRLGVAFLRSRLFTRIMSEVMATTKQPELRSWIHKQHDQYFTASANPTVVRQVFQAMNEKDVAQFAHLVPSRVLLIAGEKDNLTTVREQERLSNLFSSATLHIIPDVGHLIHYEVPAEAAKQIAQFAATNDAN